MKFRRNRRTSSWLPLDQQLQQLEKSVSSTISVLCKRVTLLESIVLKEFGGQPIIEHYSIIRLLKANFLQLQFHLKAKELVKHEPAEVDDYTDEDTGFGYGDTDTIEDITGTEDEDDCSLPPDYDDGDITDEEESIQKENADDSSKPITTKSGRTVKKKTPFIKTEPNVKIKQRDSDLEDYDPLTDFRYQGSSRKSRSANKSTVCDECGASYTSASNLRAHKKIHEDPGQFKCEECGERFRSEFKREAHKLHYHSEDRQYQCEICYAAFKDRAQKKIHMKVHGDERPFVCSKCPKSFKHKTGMTRHALVHEKIRPYPCPICSKRFYELNKVKRHIHQVHKDAGEVELPKPPKVPRPPRPPPPRRIRTYPRVICEYCGARVSSKGYRFHLQTHDLTKFLCNLCGKGHATEHAMLKHRKLAHDPSRPFKCERPDCDERFHTYRIMKVHMERHKPRNFDLKYSCDHCGVKYRHASTLQKHINSAHTHSSLYPCAKCYGIYHSRSHLKRHLLQVHKIEPEELTELMQCPKVGETKSSKKENFEEEEQQEEHEQVEEVILGTMDEEQKVEEECIVIPEELDPADIQQVIEIENC